MNALEKALHERALVAAKRYQMAEVELLEVLEKLDEKKVFRALGYNSLFQYALRELNLSEATAYNFITVARKSREIPEIKAEIKAGNLSVAKVRKIVPVMQKETASDWLEKAKTLSKPQLEKEVAKVAPQILTPEKSRYVTEKRIALQFGVSEELYEKLTRVKDLLSQKTKRSATLEEALGEMAELFLEKNDPVVKAERVLEKESFEKSTGNPQKLVQGQAGEGKRKPLPSVVRHTVFQRDQGQCSYINPKGERCEQRRWLEMHHLKMVSQGGKNTPENLTLLCSAHHKYLHLRRDKSKSPVHPNSDQVGFWG